jgi:hypothetical protein
MTELSRTLLMQACTENNGVHRLRQMPDALVSRIWVETADVISVSTHVTSSDAGRPVQRATYASLLDGRHKWSEQRRIKIREESW